MSLLRDMFIATTALGLAAALVLGLAIRGSVEPSKPIVKSERVIMPGERERAEKALQAGVQGAAGGTVYIHTPGQPPTETKHNKQEFETIWNARKPLSRLKLPQRSRDDGRSHGDIISYESYTITVASR